MSSMQFSSSRIASARRSVWRSLQAVPQAQMDHIALRRPALAVDRARPRRPFADGRRQRRAAARVLLRRHRRRPVEDHRRRHHLEAGHRRRCKTSSVGAVAVAPSNPDVVYVGTGETELRGNIIQGDGVYKIDRRRQDVDALGLADDAGHRADPRPPDQSRLVYVAAFGHPYGPNPERGVFRSKDGGKTWERVLFRDDKTGAIDLVDRSGQSRRALRRAVGGLPHAVRALERRPRQRPVQERPTAATTGPS